MSSVLFLNCGLFSLPLHRLFYFFNLLCWNLIQQAIRRWLTSRYSIIKRMPVYSIHECAHTHGLTLEHTYIRKVKKKLYVYNTSTTHQNGLIETHVRATKHARANWGRERETAIVRTIWNTKRVKTLNRYTILYNTIRVYILGNYCKIVYYIYLLLRALALVRAHVHEDTEHIYQGLILNMQRNLMLWYIHEMCTLKMDRFAYRSLQLIDRTIEFPIRMKFNVCMSSPRGKWRCVCVCSSPNPHPY